MATAKQLPACHWAGQLGVPVGPPHRGEGQQPLTETAIYSRGGQERAPCFPSAYRARSKMRPLVHWEQNESFHPFLQSSHSLLAHASHPSHLSKPLDSSPECTALAPSRSRCKRKTFRKHAKHMCVHSYQVQTRNALTSHVFTLMPPSVSSI